MSDDSHDDPLDDLDDPGVIAEFVEFVLDNGKYFLIPILLVLLLLWVLIMLGTTSAAPFIYTLW